MTGMRVTTALRSANRMAELDSLLATDVARAPSPEPGARDGVAA